MLKERLKAINYQNALGFTMDQVIITAGCVIWALSYALFQAPFNLSTGGVSGVAIIVKHYTGFPLGTFFLLANIPLLILGYFQLDRLRFLLSTMWAVVVFSFTTDFFVAHLPAMMERFPVSDDTLLNAIYGGVLAGVGTGIIYRAGGTFGGTTIIARIVNKKTGFPISQCFMYTDFSVILGAGLVFNWEVALLSILVLLISGITSDVVLEGISYVRTAMIITENPYDVSRALMEEMGRGVTLWNATGGYSGQAKHMIYCTVRRSEIQELKRLMTTVDPNAFFVIGVAQQAFGQGFTRLTKGPLQDEMARKRFRNVLRNRKGKKTMFDEEYLDLAGVAYFMDSKGRVNLIRPNGGMVRIKNTQDLDDISSKAKRITKDEALELAKHGPKPAEPSQIDQP